MFTVTKKLLVDGVYYFPDRAYKGNPGNISPRYLVVAEDKRNQVADESKPVKRKRRRAVVRNSAITNRDKE